MPKRKIARAEVRTKATDAHEQWIRGQLKKLNLRKFGKQLAAEMEKREDYSASFFGHLIGKHIIEHMDLSPGNRKIAQKVSDAQQLATINMKRGISVANSRTLVEQTLLALSNLKRTNAKRGVDVAPLTGIQKQLLAIRTDLKTNRLKKINFEPDTVMMMTKLLGDYFGEIIGEKNLVFLNAANQQLLPVYLEIESQRKQ